MENKLALYQPKNLSLKEIDYLGEVMAASGRFATIRDKAQAVVQILAGQELNYPPLVAMTKINIIQGKISVSAELMAAMIKRSGEYDYKVVKHTKTECSVQFFHNGEKGYLSTFTIEDAKAAGVVKPGSGWQKFPRAMLFSRALSQGARIECPHLLNGAYTSEEMGAVVNEDGEVIEHEIVPPVKEQVIEDAKVVNEKPAEKPNEKPTEKPAEEQPENIAEEKITPAQWTSLCKTAMTCKNPDGVMLGIPRMFETIKSKFNVKLGTDLTINQLEIVENDLLHKWETGEWHE